MNKKSGLLKSLEVLQESETRFSGFDLDLRSNNWLETCNIRARTLRSLSSLLVGVSVAKKSNALTVGVGGLTRKNLTCQSVLFLFVYVYSCNTFKVLDEEYFLIECVMHYYPDRMID